MMINLVDTPRRARATLALIVAVSIVSALLLNVRAVSGDTVGGRADIVQISSYGPNNQAAYMMLGFAALMVWFTYERRLGRKLAYLLAWIVVLVSIMATASRGAMVSLAVVLFCGLLLDKRLWLAAVPAPAVGLLAIGLFPALLDRLQTIITLSDRGAGRLDIWRVGLRIVAAHPFLGVGWGNYGMAYERYLFDTSGLAMFALRGMGSHNDFLGTLGELGVVGLALFVLMIGFTLYSALRVVLNEKTQDGPMSHMAMSTLLGLVGVLAAGLFVDLRGRKFFWVMLALSAAVARLSSEPERMDGK
jgi:putative inorganic carbon (HCO3(-)) transporter